MMAYLTGSNRMTLNLNHNFAWIQNELSRIKQNSLTQLTSITCLQCEWTQTAHTGGSWCLLGIRGFSLFLRILPALTTLFNNSVFIIIYNQSGCEPLNWENKLGNGVMRHCPKRNYLWRESREESSVSKVVVVSLGYKFWSPLECWWRNVTIFSCQSIL